MAKKDYHKKTPERAKYMNDYTREWNKANTYLCATRFSRSHDADIIKMLESVPSKIDYLRRLIREDMDSHGISFGTEDSDDED